MSQELKNTKVTNFMGVVADLNGPKNTIILKALAHSTTLFQIEHGEDVDEAELIEEMNQINDVKYDVLNE